MNNDSPIQQTDSAVLRMVAARIFIERLSVPVQPDWGIVAQGLCECEKGAECTRAGKHPSVSRPRERATRDMEKVECWVRAGRNLAVAPLSYLVLDVEIKPGRDGLTPLLRWFELAGLDAAEQMTTLTVRSGGGGLHLWYWLTEAQAARPPKGMDGWLPDVDVKTSAQISDKATIPGSRHASGQLYTFELNALDSAGLHLPRQAPRSS